MPFRSVLYPPPIVCSLSLLGYGEDAWRSAGCVIPNETGTPMWLPVAAFPATAAHDDAMVYNCTYPYVYDVTWDPAKARMNFRQHGIPFPDAVAVLEDERALTMRDAFSEDEERWITLGLDGFGRVLVVIYAWRGEGVRLISARKATARERRNYEEADEA